MRYDINKLPDFFSVRNYEQIDYALEGMEGKKCYCFFDNGFSSNIIESNKRNIKFIWDGFILFVDSNITLEDIENGIDLYNGRLVALQRTNLLGKTFNNNEIRQYIINQLQNKSIEFEIMKDSKQVDGYPSKCDLWSTRNSSVLLDAIDCVGVGDAYFFQNTDFKYEISFNKSKIPDFVYSHLGAIVLRGENSVAISRLIHNNQKLQDYLESIVGSENVYSYLEGKFLPGVSISQLKEEIIKVVERPPLGHHECMMRT